MMLRFLLLIILRVTLAAELPVSVLLDPDSVPLVIDTSPIPAPTRTPFLHPEDNNPPQITPETTPGPSPAASSEGWGPRHTLIVAIVVCISLVVIMGLSLVFYIARRNERRRLAEIAVRNEKAVAVGRVMGSTSSTRTSKPHSNNAGREEASTSRASKTLRTFYLSTARPEKTTKNSLSKPKKTSLDKLNVAGSTRASGPIRRPPRPGYGLHDTILDNSLEESQAVWSQEVAEAVIKESDQKRVPLHLTALKESEEKEVVMVLPPGKQTLPQKSAQLTETWNHTSRRTLSKSEYMV